MLLFCDSFDYYNSSEIATKYDASQSVTVSATAARNGPQGLITGSRDFVQKNFANKTTAITGAAVNILPGSTDIILLAFRDGTNTQCCVAVTGIGRLSFERGISTVLASVVSLPNFYSIWHYIEVKATIGSSGSFEVRWDGVTIMSASGVNTQSTGAAQVNGILLGDTQAFDTGTIWSDDFYICDTSGSHNNDFLGDIKVSAAFPTANGTENDLVQVPTVWIASTAYIIGNQILDSNGNLEQCIIAGTSNAATPPTWPTTIGLTIKETSVLTWELVAKSTLQNFSFVNEPLADDALSVIGTSTLTNQDRYTSSFPTATGDVIYGLAVNMRVAPVDLSPSGTIRAVVDSNGTLADNGADIPLSNITPASTILGPLYSYYQGIFETDPSTSSPWTVSGINVTEFGIKITG